VSDHDSPVDERHPVWFGLLALVGVGIVVGLIAGVAALAGAHVLGIGGSAGTGTASDEKSMYLPKPQPTEDPSGPLVTLAPGESPSGGQQSSQPSQPKKPEKPKKQISLSSGENSVAPMQQIDLTGVYPGGEGAILQVQRFEGGAWSDFPVTASVSNETFATYVQTSQTGVNRFRVVDTDSGLTSNEVRVTIG
jgi:hypothetical protein